MTRKKRRALLCMLAVPLLALAPRSEESLPASAAEPAAVPEKYVALTFDDGPWPETTEQLLDGLAERGAKATFFLIGEQIAGHEDTVRRMADEGHQVGSHTFTHMDLSRGDPAERLREIAATDETLRALLGDGVYWLRPPWGFLAPQTAAAVEVPMVYWSLDTEDWRRLDADAVAQDIIDHARDGDIILLHDPYTTSVEAALRASGLAVDDAILRAGIRDAMLPGRFQIISDAPRVILDVAHNPHAAAYLAGRLKTLAKTGRVLAVIGMLHDKDIAGTLANLAPEVDAWYCAPLEGPRGATAEQLVEHLRCGTVYSSVAQAWRAAMADAKVEDTVLVCGSFHTVAQVMEEIDAGRIGGE